MAPRIFVVDNGGQWTHREWRVLKYLDVETEIIPNTTPFSQVADLDGLVLSGGAPRVGLSDSLGACGEYLEKARYPILGICAGHQFMARQFGGEVAPGKTPEFGKTTLHVDKAEGVLEGVPASTIVWESHNDEVVSVPNEFIALARSDTCPIQAMMHRSRPLYGLQFHPEVEHTQHGQLVFENFVKICAKHSTR
ncbi:MAG: GMP synthase subunit A [Thermoplasmatota archaeon]